LIPLPNVSGDHQLHNAKVLENVGAAKIILNNELKKENLEAVYKVNEYLKIKDIDENINISFDNGNIIMERDNNESNLLFNFVLDKETESKYFIKNLNFYIDTKVKTNHLQIDDDRIIIEYDLWLSDEYSGNFKYEIILKEV